MPNLPSTTETDLQEVTARNRTARRIIAVLAPAVPALATWWQQVDAALADVSALTAEMTRLATQLDETRLDRANLLAAARATVAAHDEAEYDPLSYLHDELQARGQLPSDTRRRP